MHVGEAFNPRYKLYVWKIYLHCHPLFTAFHHSVQIGCGWLILDATIFSRTIDNVNTEETAIPCSAAATENPLALSIFSL